MHYDEVHGWLLTKEDFLSAGYSHESYNKDKYRGSIITTGRACRGKKSEIIYCKLPERIKSVLRQRFAQLDQERERLMVEARISGMDMTEIAINSTSNLLQINAPYIQKEIEAYIAKEYGKYTSPYLELGLNLSNRSVVGYAKICALGMWIFGMTEKIEASTSDERYKARTMRSLRANLLSALDQMPRFEVSVPRNDIRFSQWVDGLKENLKAGKHITEIIEVKRAGNSNPERFTQEQKLVCDNLWISGTGLGARQVWDKMVEIGRSRGWWNDKTGKYKPVSYATISHHIEQRENILMGARTDYVNAYNNYYTTISREWPQKKNMAWGIDGTGHNENVYINGKVRQYLSVIKVFDYATFRNLHNEPTIGFTETADIVIKAVKEAIKYAGYKPYILQMDQGPAFTGVRDWCSSCGIVVMPTGKGRARSKPVELMLGQFDNLITRYLSGFTGMNRTALGRSSKPSETFELKGKTYAVSADIASQWLRTTGKEEWNGHIIEKIHKVEVKKTPQELWAEKQSETPKMDLMELSRLCGTKHTRKLENVGLEIQNAGLNYIYYPPIGTPKEQQKAAEIFTTTPRHKDEGSQLDIYITEYGKPAPVFKKNQFLGYWTLKERVSMFASFENKSEAYLRAKRVPELQHEMSKQAVTDVLDSIERLPYADVVKQIGKESLTGRKRVIGRYDKQDLNMEEFSVKAGIKDCIELETPPSSEYREYMDSDTGEIHRIKTNNK